MEKQQLTPEQEQARKAMLTDSRSFISYTRHEYFRRILCDVIGADVDCGRLPASEMERIGAMIEDICYRNARQYCGF